MTALACLLQPAPALAAEVGDFEITLTDGGGDPVAGVDYSFDDASGLLTITSTTPMTVRMRDGVSVTDDCIEVTAGSYDDKGGEKTYARLTLAGVNIESSLRSPINVAGGSALELSLADGSSTCFSARRPPSPAWASTPARPCASPAGTATVPEP